MCVDRGRKVAADKILSYEGNVTDRLDLPRWRLRLDAFSRMLDLFARTAAQRRERALNEAEESGRVQFFELVGRIASALADSYLRIFGDVTAYSLLQDDAFAAIVRRDAVPLFDATELAAAPPFSPVDGLREWYRPRAAAS